MSLTLSTSVTAMAPGLMTSVLGLGGTAPYVYSIIPNGAGGSIDSSTGIYMAPLVASNDPLKQYDTIVVTDSLKATAKFDMLITDALGLFCDVIQKELGLPQGRVYLYNQKVFQPPDASLYVAVMVLTCKPFGNTKQYDPTTGLDSIQSTNMRATLSVDIISRDLSALRRKEEVIMALNSDYSESQQEFNSFQIGKLPPGGQFVNLSNIDGAAIPYRFNISVNIQYFVKKIKAVPYFDTFLPITVTTES